MPEMSFRKNAIALDKSQRIEEGLLSAAMYPGLMVLPQFSDKTIDKVTTAGLIQERWVLLEDSFLGTDASVQIASGEYGRAMLVEQGMRVLARIKNSVTTTVDAELAFHTDGTLKLAAAASGGTPADVAVFVAMEAVASPSSGAPALCAVRAI
jgi:hypothetical protein